MVNKPGYQRTEAQITRGKMLGGSSCLNYFTWLRGSTATYDEWVDFGGPSWSFDNCWKYFLKVSQNVNIALDMKKDIYSPRRNQRNQ
jgi:choline dehydrogenase-like flavoprotein